MRLRLTASMFAAVSTALSGCAHHRVGRPPTPAEIAEINDTADPDLRPVMALLYDCDGAPCPPPSASRDGGRSIPGTRPVNIERIVAVEDGRVKVVDPDGNTQAVDLAAVRGVAVLNRNRSAARRGVFGGLITFGLAGLLVLSYDTLQGAPDQSLAGEEAARSPKPIAAQMAVLVGIGIVGAVVGILSGRRDPGEDTFDFGMVGR